MPPGMKDVIAAITADQHLIQIFIVWDRHTHVMPSNPPDLVERLEALATRHVLNDLGA